MNQVDRRIYRIGLGLLAALFATLPGCLCCRHECPSVTAACLEKCEICPRACRGNVYVFVVNGFDPFDVAKLGNARTALNRLGFTKVYTGQFYHAGQFADEIKSLAAAEPNARFVVVGVGAGVDAAVSLAESVAENGVAIDLLASVDSPFWSSAAGKKPINVQRVLSLHGRTNDWLPFTPGLEDDISVPDAGWLGVSGHAVTVETLASELASIAGAVPAPAEESPDTVDEQPVPRPNAAKAGNRPVRPSLLDPATDLEARSPGPGSVPAITASRGSRY